MVKASDRRPWRGGIRHGKLARQRAARMAHLQDARLYVFSHPACPGLVRIGQSWRPSERACELASALGLVGPFVVEHETGVLEDVSAYRIEVHLRLADAETDGWFRVSVEAARSVVDAVMEGLYEHA